MKCILLSQVIEILEETLHPMLRERSSRLRTSRNCLEEMSTHYVTVTKDTPEQSAYPFIKSLWLQKEAN